MNPLLLIKENLLKTFNRKGDWMNLTNPVVNTDKAVAVPADVPGRNDAKPPNNCQSVYYNINRHSYWRACVIQAIQYTYTGSYYKNFNVNTGNNADISKEVTN